MKTLSITKVYGADWEGLYINGELVTEGHTISLTDFIFWLASNGPVQVITYSFLDVDSYWLAEVGNLPKQLKDVKLDD